MREHELVLCVLLGLIALECGRVHVFEACGAQSWFGTEQSAHTFKATIHVSAKGGCALTKESLGGKDLGSHPTIDKSATQRAWHGMAWRGAGSHLSRRTLRWPLILRERSESCLICCVLLLGVLAYANGVTDSRSQRGVVRGQSSGGLGGW